MILRKTIPLSLAGLSVSESESGGFSGYASVFGGVDSYGDTIAPGAFAETLQKHGLPKMFFNHDWTMPVGKYLSAEEDSTGLKVTGEFTDGVSIASDVRAAMRHGTIDGLSVAGYVDSGDYKTENGSRLIQRWTRLIEVSPVVFPADESARVDAASIKSEVAEAISRIESVRDVERLLRDAGGLSKTAAVALISRMKSVLSDVGDPIDSQADQKKYADIVARVNASIRLSERCI